MNRYCMIASRRNPYREGSEEFEDFEAMRQDEMDDARAEENVGRP